MNSTQVDVGKIESRTDGAAPAGVSQPVGFTLEYPRILDLLLRIPVDNTDSLPRREAPVGCGCERGRACPFRVLCAE
jgi:hypothetical protein